MTSTRDLDGRLELFASGEGRVDRRAQSAPNVWQDWESFGPGTSGSGFGTNANGRIEIIAGTSAGPLNGRYQLVPSGGWSPWAPVGGPPLA
ncbi:hypothetical protein [Streptomyces abikoensis]|uniref:PLL-like beta propeller domain-containing protein n=1 Tax=Streptomyces abikoensis TaxID=97398 RepID=A0ABW7SVX9_9ACTN